MVYKKDIYKLASRLAPKDNIVICNKSGHILLYTLRAFTCCIIVMGLEPPDPVLQNAPSKHFIKEDELW